MTDTSTRVRRRQANDGPTDRMREYLEIIYYLSVRSEPVIAARLADWMQISAPTVSDGLARLERAGYISRDSRNEIRLTAAGYTLAESVVRRHRILERFLNDVLHVPWHAIHPEAVRLEAALSPLLEERITALVGAAPVCPHGNPIPGTTHVPGADQPLSSVVAGQDITIARIAEEAEDDLDLMRHFEEHGLMPGALFRVATNSVTFGVTLKRDDQALTLSPQVAGMLHVWGGVE